MTIRKGYIRGLAREKSGVVVLKSPNNLPKLLIFALYHLLYGRINQSAVLMPLY